MKVAQRVLDDAKVHDAIEELKRLVLTRDPRARFDVGPSFDPVGVSLEVTTDLDDPDEIMDSIIDRLVDIQVDEGVADLSPYPPGGRLRLPRRARER